MKDKIKKVLTKHGVLYKQDEIVEDIYNSLIIPVDKDNLPTHEVIAKDWKGDWLIGFLHEFPERRSNIWCESAGDSLEGVTHYMEIPKLK